MNTETKPKRGREPRYGNNPFLSVREGYTGASPVIYFSRICSEHMDIRPGDVFKWRSHEDDTYICLYPSITNSGTPISKHKSGCHTSSAASAISAGIPFGEYMVGPAIDIEGETMFKITPVQQ